MIHPVIKIGALEGYIIRYTVLEIMVIMIGPSDYPQS